MCEIRDASVTAAAVARVGVVVAGREQAIGEKAADGLFVKRAA